LKRALVELAPDRVSSRERLTSTYYDTPRLALKQQGLTLRVREQGGRYIQTVKTGELIGAGMLSRGEWEDTVAEARPDPHAPQSGERLPRGITADLRGIFVTDVTRTSVEIGQAPESQITASVDEGAIRRADGGGIEPISEVELELKSGRDAALYDLALQLLEVAPLRLEMRSKSERGYRLVEGAEAVAPVFHAEPVALEPTMTLEKAWQRIGGSCLVHLMRNESAAVSGQAEGVHQMRIALRRLRSALSAVRKMLSAEDHRWVSGELVWLVSILGPARDLDVFRSELLEPAHQALPDEAGLADLAAVIERSRRVAYDRVREALFSERYTAAMLRLLRWFEARGWRGPPASPSSALLAASISEVAPFLLDRRRRRVRRSSKGFDQLTSRERHQLRIAGKKLRYTIELFESLFDHDRVQKYVRTLKRLQDDLGYANDVRVGYEMLPELTAQAPRAGTVARAGTRLLDWHNQRLAKGERKFGRRVRRVNSAQPFWKSHPPIETRC
jgi:inorganic triphosphatase YgiF